MRKTLVGSILIIASLAAGQSIATADGPDASAAKKCKKGYKKNKKGKCVKKKFAPKSGTYKSGDGNTQLRVVKKSGKRYVELIRTPRQTLQCSNGTTTQSGAGGSSVASVPVKGKSFSGTSRLATLKGKFTSTKAMSGSYTLSGSPVPGITCKGTQQSFSAKR